QVFVDGARRGYVYELQTRGLALEVGRTHQIAFQQSGCEPFETVVRIAPDATTGPSISYQCDFLPARFKVVSNVKADVLSSLDGRRLGSTNQEIPQQMDALSKPLKLTVRTPDGKSERRALRLKAGEKVEVKVLF
ncbi:MAG: hypothetical protein KC583_00290, partial [Myxococcales bacterium]|nr:hypothetical protein [Myxococcales bacterium]